MLVRRATLLILRLVELNDDVGFSMNLKNAELYLEWLDGCGSVSLDNSRGRRASPDGVRQEKPRELDD